MLAEHVGFTGTRKGMSFEQAQEVQRILSNLRGQGVAYFHHGDCQGSDELAHMLAHALEYSIIIHPPEISTHRAWCSSAVSIRGSKPYLVRNRDIVDESSLLIATPRESQMQLRSGTWSTVRYARMQRKPVHLVLPDGSLS